MKFSGKMWLMIILKVTKKLGFTLSLENIFLEKPQGGGGSNWPPSLLRVKFLLKLLNLFRTISMWDVVSIKNPKIIKKPQNHIERAKNSFTALSFNLIHFDNSHVLYKDIKI